MGSQGSWDTVNRALHRVSGAGRRGTEWTTYLCPVHEADGRRHRASLGVVYNLSRQRTVIRCFAGCSDVEVLERLGLRVRDLFDAPAAPTAGRAHSRADLAIADRAILAAGLPLSVHKKDFGPRIGKPRRMAGYIYRWPDGSPAGCVVRVRALHRQGYVKSFYQQRRTENGWEFGGFERLPFHLPEVIEAVAARQDIFVCEGEADVLTATHAGLTATCNAGGASGWYREHGRWLRGARRVWVVADRDAPGYRHAVKVAESLVDSVAEIRVVQARDGKDLTDHCNAGHQISELDPVPVLDEHYRPA
ncbi:toprim domain-containing protein [Nocardia tengchongensis]|uniref:Toprim domain-containing protein n=1 Tax=Nocardia tengchongensis TaxID=2055889 RepID=A0ABX8CGR1_9NOCA|nr:toprim domain-containing protein [Nocardia tengchongensis]QVI19147.1 toprim domain-containing protein [Nocardia tengchongensis]